MMKSGLNFRLNIFDLFVCVIPWQIEAMGLPSGPTDMAGLFQWGQYNSEIFLETSQHAAKYRENFKRLMEYQICVHDCYSGLGTASTTLHIQHKHLARTILIQKSFMHITRYKT